MLWVSFFTWWYGRGFDFRVSKITGGFQKTLDYFSFDLLLKTLFAPFRQIDAGKLLEAPIDVKIRKFFDRLFSRCIGGFMRILVILLGIVWLVLQGVCSLVILAVYAVLPFIPVAGLVMMLIGWVPVWPF